LIELPFSLSSTIHAKNNRISAIIQTNLEVVTAKIVTSSFTFHHAISEKNVAGRSLASYGFVTIALRRTAPSTFSWVNHWWIGDGIVGFGSCDQSLFFCTIFFSLVRPPLTALPLLFVKPNVHLFLWSLMQNTIYYTIYYAAVYRYLPLCVYTMHTKTQRNRKILVHDVLQLRILQLVIC